MAVKASRRRLQQSVFAIFLHRFPSRTQSSLSDALPPSLLIHPPAFQRKVLRTGIATAPHFSRRLAEVCRARGSDLVLLQAVVDAVHLVEWAPQASAQYSTITSHWSAGLSSVLPTRR